MISDTYVHSGNLRALVLVKTGFESSLEMNWDAFPGKTQFYPLLLESPPHGFNFLLLVKLPQLSDSYMLWDSCGVFLDAFLTSTFPGYQLRTGGVSG